MSTRQVVGSAREAAQTVLESTSNDLRKQIAQKEDPGQVADEINALPDPAVDLVYKLLTLGREELAEADVQSEELGEVKDWILSFHASLPDIAERIETSGSTGMSPVENPISGIGSYCTYYPAVQRAILRLVFHGDGDEVIFKNAESVSDVLKTSRNIAEHVAKTYKELSDAGCALDLEERHDDVETLARIQVACRKICKSRGIPLKDVTQKRKELTNDQDEQG